MTTLKRFLLLLILSFVLLSAVLSEEVNPFEEYEDALGGYYGEIGGAGLSYQHWFGKIGIQTALGLIYYSDDMMDYSLSPNFNTDSVDVDIFVYNIGVELQYMLYQDSYSDWFDGSLYLFAGGKHDGAVRSTYLYEEVTEDVLKEYPKSGESAPFYVPMLSAGFGFGFEPVFLNHVSIPIEFGLMGKWQLGVAMPIDAGLKFQGGLRYRF